MAIAKRRSCRRPAVWRWLHRTRAVRNCATCAL